jgi:hypothetical protein
MTTPTSTPLVTTFLRYDDDLGDAAIDAVRAALFGVLAELAAPVVEHYWSDLYRDAQYLMEFVTGDSVRSEVASHGCYTQSFDYAVRSHGTSLGTDRNLVTYIPHTAAYQVILSRSDRGKWEATVLPI